LDLAPKSSTVVQHSSDQKSGSRWRLIRRFSLLLVKKGSPLRHKNLREERLETCPKEGWGSRSPWPRVHDYLRHTQFSGVPGWY
jgi:hypothetical protein